MTVRLALLFAITCFSFESASAAEWINMLEGQSLGHWMKQDGSQPAPTWQFNDGWLHLNGKGGNLITKQEYPDFELWFEFRISEKGNSGIKYRVKQYDGRYLGLEYQVLDDNAFPKLLESHKTGSVYHVVTPIPAEKKLKSPGEINVAKVRVQGNRIQHWINGQLLIDQNVGDDVWRGLIQKSKFKSHEGFGENQLGRIMLTDHGCEVWYRNIYLKPLSSGVSCNCN